MRSIDVIVTRGDRVLGDARQRPVRITPHKRAGVVYKGRVYEVRATPEGSLCIDTEGKSWDAEVFDCPFATPNIAKQLLSSLTSTAVIKPSRARTSRPGKEAKSGRDLAASGTAKGDGDADAVREILKLLALPGA